VVAWFNLAALGTTPHVQSPPASGPPSHCRNSIINCELLFFDRLKTMTLGRWSHSEIYEMKYRGTFFLKKYTADQALRQQLPIK
jgi:hypothetical protein